MDRLVAGAKRQRTFSINRPTKAIDHPAKPAFAWPQAHLPGLKGYPHACRDTLWFGEWETESKVPIKASDLRGDWCMFGMDRHTRSNAGGACKAVDFKKRAAHGDEPPMALDPGEVPDRHRCLGKLAHGC